MSYQDNNKPYVRETVHTNTTSSSSMPLIIGGLVVAVAFILWLVFGGDGSVVTTDPAGDTTNTTIETPAAPADNTTNVTIEPAAPEAADPVDRAADPAADAVAPADGAETAPAEGTATTPAPVEE